jgi:hypothetical protein
LPSASWRRRGSRREVGELLGVAQAPSATSNDEVAWIVSPSLIGIDHVAALESGEKQMPFGRALPDGDD